LVSRHCIAKKSVFKVNKRAALSVELALAADVLVAFDEGADLEKTLEELVKKTTQKTNQLNTGQVSVPAIKEFMYRAVRELGLLDALSKQLNAKEPLPWLLSLQQVVMAQLLQIDDLEESSAAVARLVDQAIEAVKADKQYAFASGFLNATLRRFLRERDALVAKAIQEPEASYNHPEWWIELLKIAHPLSWHNILAAGNGKAPFTLRVNRRLCSAQSYVEAFAQSDIAEQVAGLTASRVSDSEAVILSQPVPVFKLPGFAEGMVSVQDAGAQLAAHLLDLKDGQRVLDACAAPGGKTVHCLELADIEITALDISSERLARVAENLSRFRAGLAAHHLNPSLNYQLKVGDARIPSGWWDGQQFDRILADVPCTASGIVRRHPDIRWRRQRGDLATFSSQQLEILAGLWPLLRPGGKLLYVTCSVFLAEGKEVVERFIAGRRNAVLEPLQDLSTLTHLENGYLLPNGPFAEHDGFFYARLCKPL
jgi:16S rRNA (cytosine967-C5)-methyltransferase